MDQESELRTAKRRALALLLGAGAVFVGTLFVPESFATGWIRAAAEAAMVGGMADWFAVVALFRRIPVPGLAGHTNIIIRKRDDIADGLAVFVKEKFLDRESVLNLIDRHNPAEVVTEWLKSPDNTRRMGGAVAHFLRNGLDLLDEKEFETFAANAIATMIDRADLSHYAADILDLLTRDGRHQALLESSIVNVVEVLRRDETRRMIAEQIVAWLKKEHRIKEKLMPSERIGNYGADVIADALSSILEEVERDNGHQLRMKFDQAVQALIVRLKSDAAFRANIERIKRDLGEHPAFHAYLAELWNETRERLKADLATEDSTVYRKVVAAGEWIGAELARNPSLRESLNRHLRDAAGNMAPEFADFITRHISSTVRSWDAKNMSRQIELNVGKDLQYIRMNGTLVGGLIGAVLYLLEQLPGRF